MTTTDRSDTWQRTMVSAFVSLADTLTEHFDVVEFLQSLTEETVALGLADESGILLADSVGQLQVVAASEERTRLLELFQLQNREGPCLDCWRGGQAVSVPDLAEQEARWPQFAPKALSVGFHSVHAVPLSLRATHLGALNLFHTEVGGMDDDGRVIARGLADIASIGLLQQRTLRESQLAAEQLQTALHSRIAIEQAKGMVAEHLDNSVDEAFGLLRAYARKHNQRLTDVARSVIDGQRSAEELRGA